METAQAMSEPVFQSLEDAVVVAETTLLDTQVAVESLRAELDQFTRLHQIQLGPLYGRLDELDALTAETEAAMTGDPEAIRRAVEARARVDGEDPMLFAAANAGLLEEDGEGGAEQEQKPPRPSRERGPGPRPGRAGAPEQDRAAAVPRAGPPVAPDLVQDPAEIARRSAFITRVNAAYEKDDLPALQKLSEEWSLTSSGPAGPSAARDVAPRPPDLAAREAGRARPGAPDADGEPHGGRARGLPVRLADGAALDLRAALHGDRRAETLLNALIGLEAGQPFGRLVEVLVGGPLADLRGAPVGTRVAAEVSDLGGNPP